MRQTDGWRCSCGTPAVGIEKPAKTREGRTFGCGLLENVADLVVQRCRRTRRDPSSSIERRRQVARSWVRLKFMVQAHTAEGQAMSSAFRIRRRCRGDR